MPAPLHILPSPPQDEEALPSSAPTQDDLIRQVRAETEGLLGFAMAETDPGSNETFKEFERALLPRIFALARLLIALFLCVREQRECGGLPERPVVGGRRFQRRPPQPRNLHTYFGAVRYWRTYLRGPVVQGIRKGFHPLDAALGLTADGLSFQLLSLAARLATKLSFAQVQLTLTWFLLRAPSTEVIEQTVLGLGRRTAEWVEHAPAKEGDGEVLIVQFDSKGAPTATNTELSRRRGKRKNRPARCRRHRGRDHRGRHPKKPRRKKGDKSKNARMATLVVMYTLRRGDDGKLHGPINVWRYASFAPKRHAFEIARREADKRGFKRGSGKLVQVLTDGDDDLAVYVKQHFPEAIHTLDVIHVSEKLWAAGECLYPEGSEELSTWVDQQKQRLYDNDVEAILEHLRKRLSAIPPTGPGNKGRRERLEKVIGYMDKRRAQMNYRDRLKQDLEIATGMVEGAVKYVIGNRFDHGGMRWIRERAEALLQLRCIELNGDWDRFVDWVHDDMRAVALAQGTRLRLQQRTPSALPTLAEAA